MNNIDDFGRKVTRLNRKAGFPPEMRNSFLTSSFQYRSRKESKRAEIQNQRLSGDFGYDSSGYHYRQGYHFRQPFSFRYGNIDMNSICM